MTPVEVTRGDGPVVLGLPHTGTWLPEDVRARMNARGRELRDTDWHIHRLYDGLLPGATTVRATFHRYVIDANRDPSGQSLYPGRNTTGLVPLTDFDGEPIWDEAPNAEEIEARRVAYHAPYHAALEAELERVRQRHGVAILYDCHSIRSHIPFLFDGTLPDFNIGTNMGATCAPAIESATREICERSECHTTTVNGRFKGGWTTRHYGRPAEGLHAIQMELAQSTYLTEEAPPWAFDAEKADGLRRLLASILESLADLAPFLGGKR
ncbi:formiminoglutamase [Limimaricola soesokkakensis]|uniref:Formiminoglutamase n=1 Tax=Limimaricola soesokkakensis TaxID=1343159 RepID=A0A1X6ZRA8_9RHOB|nr:N-formylglutamate deformylase [Limimaricola soesokkakensis]PSK85775.1 formiminoglutamase [Limimaricola soesokkakensis]SLN57288.1 N-formylglutamate amidohydrolase [Limimaricola soesokkakensis]